MKKNIFIPLSFLLLPFVLFAQTPSTSLNFVMETRVKAPGKTTSSQLSSLPVAQANRTINYMDGLGRPLQTVEWQGSPSGKDLVQVKAYDALGRELKQYLPYAEQSANDGAYKSSGLSNQSSFYSSGLNANIPITNYPFSQTVFEASPLNRVLEQGAPGLVWQPSSSRTSTTGRSQVIDYNTNTAADTVRLWVAGASGASAGTNFYGAGKLYKTVTKDENWTNGKIGTSEEFKDLEGRVVLKRVWQSEGVGLNTYYVYDDFGNLRYVIPPAVSVTSFSHGDVVFKDFIYGYQYDGRRRVIEKRIPGKGLQEMVYNELDQLVFSQDANQKEYGGWLFNKYDVMGRVIISGEIGGGTRLSLQTSVDAQTGVLWETRDPSNLTLNYTGYTTTALPLVNYSAINYVINYYDDYNFYGNSSTYAATVSQSSQTKGLLTATRARGGGGLKVMYYDNEARVIETVAVNHLQGIDRTVNTYSFAGELETSTRMHKLGTFGAITTTIADVYEYDHVGRKLKTKQKINTQDQVVLSKLDYNEVGQLKQKHLHSTDGTTYAQNTKYAYNERGWLKNSANAQFSIKLGYDTLANPQYNGNISAQLWGNGNSYLNQFLYQYDGLNRLTDGTSIGMGMSEAMTYDVMGNIKTLKRDASTGTYNYIGNRLNRVFGLGSNNFYLYDANGNTITDGNRGVVLTYNYLNLPITVNSEFEEGSIAITYTYDGAGKKLKKVSNGATTDYVDGIQYNTNQYNSTIDFIQNEEGIAKGNGSGVYNYHYNLTDHLGNVRYTFDIDQGAVRPLQQDNYYAFGLRKVVSGGNNKYLYNGKELQSELEQYDYGARFYDPKIARWNSVDPLAELDRKTTPYAYVFNNPISFIDPDGMFGDYYKTNGEYLGSDGINDDKVYTADSKSIKTNKDGTSSTTFNNANQLSIKHSVFQKQAATVYAESSVGYGIENKEEMFSIASVHQKNKIAYAANSPMAKKFLDVSLGDRDGAMQIANSAVINAVTGGRDFSNGADQWDGAEQAMVSKTNMDKASNGRFMYKMNVMGWSMNDSHYNSWKSAVNSRFGEGKFSVPQEKAALHNYGGMTNKGKIRINSTAQYGLTMFWKTK